jgi:ribonuclease D
MYLVRLDALRSWRKSIAQEMRVSSDVILPRDLLYSVAEQGPRETFELAEILSDVPWRMEKFGGQILQVVAECQVSRNFHR